MPDTNPTLRKKHVSHNWNFWNLLHTHFVIIIVFEDISKVDYDLAIHTEEIRRLDNDQRSGTMQLNTQKNSIKMESTIQGWNIGGQINGGFRSPYTGNMAGITITGGYSRSTTKTTEKTISEVADSQCEAKYSCWTEAWTVKTLTPLLDSDGKTPFHLELAFRLPILPLWEKPQIIGYKAGRYLLKSGEQGYTEYDPDQQIAKYRDASNHWHYYEAYPNLDDQVRGYKHPHPVIRSVKNRCYDLDSAEWYCANRTGEDKFYTEDEGYYTKPSAPVPTSEEMDRADRLQWHVSKSQEACHDKARKCGWFGKPPACGIHHHQVGARRFPLGRGYFF
ncbi:hypothetical protein MAC_05209 [Metarhizium acridum CQMa 102]|uniref:Uncharacterized protein n=1 Tax=Metarhizium acridum (strain CQMa 102) TaxID=655827 RepID=E9E5R1_METAQ|nr:uncharacterized protein MAC_05209 [Metarhizium acridum CQMa 102]EFY88774.1 hypothetical protein MAC_05209 [Metarhizium acridum CQMa 102]